MVDMQTRETRDGEATFVFPTTENGREKAGQQGLSRRFLFFMMPVMLDFILQSFSGTIGSAYVGRMLGPRALAAVSTFYPLLLVLVSCGVGLGTGASVLVGQYWGAGNRASARRIAAAGIGVGFFTGVGIAVAGQFLIRPLLGLFATPADVMEEAVHYGRTLMLGTPALVTVIVVAIVLRGTGDSVRPLAMMGVQILSSLLLTPLLIRTDLGTAGVAYAAMAGWGIALVVAGIWLRLSRHALAPDRAFLPGLLPHWSVLAPVLRLGLPAMVEIMTMGLAEIALVGRINGFGSDMTAAYGLFTQTLTYIEYPGMAVGITVSVMCAHAIGARNEPEARAVLRLGLVVGVLLTGALAGLVIAVPDLVSSLFTSDPHVIALSRHALRTVMWSAVALALGGILGGAMRASGDVMAPMAIILGCIVCVELPVGYLAAHWYGQKGVWLGYPASFSAIFLATLAYWAVVWRRRPLLPVI